MNNTQPVVPNILPLVDVLLVLVVMLLLMSPFMAASIQAKLPKATGGVAISGAVLKLELSHDNSLKLDGKSATRLEVLTRAKSTGLPIQLYADRLTPYAFVAELLGFMAAGDITQIQLMVEQKLT